jgi:hypothetical protein
MPYKPSIIPASPSVNQFWVEGVKLNRVSSRFFSFGANRVRQDKKTAPDWTELRDRWEYSHVARAACALVNFVALVVAISQIA